MIAPRHLPRAPIQEALISLTVRKLDDSLIEELATLPSDLREEYPKCEQIFTQKFDFQIQEGLLKSKTVAQNPAGFKFTSRDGKNVVQFKTDGFVFSRLKPYDTWESMSHESRKLWQAYVKLAKPQTIVRVATRYINRIMLPLPIGDFGDYLTEPPRVPETLPQGISGFLSRVVMYEPELDVSAIFTQAMEQSTNDRVVPIVVDIDVFQDQQYDVSGSEYWDLLGQMREFKNRIFFEAITEKIVELCK